MSGDREWSTEEQRWIYPDEPGQPNGATLKLAFWEALKRCRDDVHDMEYPYHDDPLIDGRLPDVLWEHMTVALAELRAVAGVSSVAVTDSDDLDRRWRNSRIIDGIIAYYEPDGGSSDDDSGRA